MGYLKHDARNVFAFNHAFVSSICIVSINLFLLLGCSVGVLSKTASEANSDFDSIMGTPEAFVADIYDAADDFIADHFGSVVVAVAFSLGLKAIVK